MPKKPPRDYSELVKELLLASHKSPPPATGTTSLSDDEKDAATRVQWSLSTQQVIGKMALLGEPVPTGITYIDRYLRHKGIPPSKFFLIGGPPQSGKSLLMAQMMDHMSLRVPVFTLMADAGWFDTALNLAAFRGFDKSAVEKDPFGHAGKIAEAMGERSIIHVNPEHPDATLANFFGFVSETCPQDLTPVCFVDSAQVIRHGLQIDKGDDRSNPELVGSLCRTFSARSKAIVLLSSKANRAYYRNRDKKENATAISSFMGGDYEYTADAAVVLSRPDKDSGFIAFEFPKNRLGDPHPPDLTLRYDDHTHTLLEVDQAEIDAKTYVDKVARAKPIKEKIISICKQYPNLSKNAILELAGGRRLDVFAAVDQLVSEKKLLTFPSKNGRGFTYNLDPGYVDGSLPGTTN